MFRYSIDLDQRSDVEDVVAVLRERADRSGLPASVIDELLASARSSIEPLIRNGAKLAELGSRMQAVRKVNGPGYAVTLRFGAQRTSVLARLVRAIRGH